MKIGLNPVPYQDVNTYISRVEEAFPGILASSFSDPETCKAVLQSELNYVHDLIHFVRVRNGSWTEGRPVDAFTILAVAKTIKIKVEKGETVRSFTEKVNEKIPGLLNELGKTPEQRDQRIQQGLRAFHKKSDQGRIGVIMALLMLVFGMIMLTLVKQFGVPNPELKAFTEVMIIMSLLSSGFSLMMAFKIRCKFAQNEKNPEYI